MTTGEKLTALPATNLPEGSKPGVPDSPQTPVQTPAEAPTLETQVKTLTEANGKLEGQRKSLDQRLSKVQSESASSQQIRDDLEDLRLEVSGIPNLLVEGFKAAATGNTDEMASVLSGTQQRNRAERETTLRQSRYTGLQRRMGEFMDDSEAVAAWQAEVERQNNTRGAQSLEGFQEILEAARGVKFKSELAAKDVVIAERDTQLKEARGNFEKEYEIDDVNTGPAAGAAGTPSVEALMQADKRKIKGLKALGEAKKALEAHIASGDMSV